MATQRRLDDFFNYGTDQLNLGDTGQIAPQGDYAPQVPQVPQQQVSQFGGGGTPSGSGWVYDWRPEAYQAELSPAEQAQQREEYSFRAQHQGEKLPEDSAGLYNLMHNGQQGQSQSQSSPGVQMREPAGFEGLRSTLSQLFDNQGEFNQDIVNRRTEGAREALQRFGKSRNETNRAALANRGLLGSGPEMTAQNRAEQDIADRFAQATSQIYADESGAADSRMMDALRLASGLESGDLDRQLSETLGLGNLALGNQRASNEYNLGLGRLGLDRDSLGWDIQSGGTDQLLTLLQLMMQGAGTSAGGYI